MMKSITQDSSDTHAYTQNFEHFLQLRKILQQMKRGTYLWKWEYDNTVTVRFFCLDTLQSLSWTDPDGKESTDSVDLSEVIDIVAGQPSENDDLAGYALITILSEARAVHIVPPTIEDFVLWYKGLCFLCGIEPNLPGESKEQDGTAEREHRSDAVAPAHSHTHPSSRMPTPATRTQHSNTSSTTTSSQTPQLNAPAETQKETIERLHTQNKNLLALAAEQQEIIQQLIAWVKQTSTRQSKQAKNSSRTTTKANNSAEHDNLFIQDLMKQIEKLKNTVRAKDETIQQLHAINIWNNEQ